MWLTRTHYNLCYPLIAHGLYVFVEPQQFGPGSRFSSSKSISPKCSTSSWVTTSTINISRVGFHMCSPILWLTDMYGYILRHHGDKDLFHKPVGSNLHHTENIKTPTLDKRPCEQLMPEHHKYEQLFWSANHMLHYHVCSSLVATTKNC